MSPSEQSANSRPRRLVVLVHGLNGTPASWASVLAKLQEQPGWKAGGTEYLVFHGKTNPIGWKRLDVLGKQLGADITARWLRAGGFEEIILAGHSMGGLLVRQAFLEAVENDDLSEGDVPRWNRKVTRIVLMASPNRGVGRLKWWQRLPHALSQRIWWPVMTYQDLMRGSIYVTDLRIGWIRLFSSAKTAAPLPEVIQLLGTNDDVVVESDSVDVLASSDKSSFLRVPAAGHVDLIRLDGLEPGEADLRWTLFRTAFMEPMDRVASVATHVPGTQGQQAAASGNMEPMDRVASVATHVPGTQGQQATASGKILFILHGIRASRMDDWIKQVEGAAKKLSPPYSRIIRPTYGYFAAIRFALPSVRRRNLMDFCDEYTEALAANPGAEFDFIGHSNGTYILGHSLLGLRRMVFRNVVIAGSVLPKEFPWHELVGSRIKRVKSDRGRFDWPVGILCSALHDGFFMKDVGTGGYNGFLDANYVEEEGYHGGGHGSMFSSDNIPRMVAFASGREWSGRPAELVGSNALFDIASRGAWLLLWLLLAGIGCGLFFCGGWPALVIGAAAIYLILDLV